MSSLLRTYRRDIVRRRDAGELSAKESSMTRKELRAYRKQLKREKKQGLSR